MPKRVSWRDMVVDVDVTEADAVVATLKPFNIDKSQTRTCTICPEAEHKMRYRLLVCSSEGCSEASAVKCGWRGNIATYLELEHASNFEYGDHNTVASSPKRNKLSSTQTAFLL
ncbi:hypothetical protein PC129_g10384 [Phytophthora cactorum]|uniref:Uncharacterized protein n=1 Tax=Phytophthora cactorum TaxID=29920 RepID=A0A329SWI4_9STRA|nr:hypothetical protein Pcac1_g2519 [Phytophthora cactorum]KAG2818688.1 hypothetical protein PC112_g12508 [Phytophthora cactorum]KAG2820825.1 hypothetical protein PC111_g11289 [Phytophthora cactorum]KAG2854610.1 hypothetical protein PC113_g13153 [Phytophthora cactorum]KAG2900041.1 hypothetical protein PC114_g13678 [Phytophthora cactorum]